MCYISEQNLLPGAQLLVFDLQDITLTFATNIFLQGKYLVLTYIFDLYLHCMNQFSSNK